MGLFPVNMQPWWMAFSASHRTQICSDAYLSVLYFQEHLQMKLNISCGNKVRKTCGNQ